jgi:hypothetical protein
MNPGLSGKPSVPKPFVFCETNVTCASAASETVPGRGVGADAAPEADADGDGDGVGVGSG